MHQLFSLKHIYIQENEGWGSKKHFFLNRIVNTLELPTERRETQRNHGDHVLVLC